MHKERTDRLTAAKVERGLYIQSISSTVEAAKYFQTVGVPVSVAIRVLTTEARRPPQDYGPLTAPGVASWRDIVRSSGPTFGFPVLVRPNE
ncbi:hypothetical protein [Massilia glaciei]|uniref:Uncharacterized protein n=1 Tax=Massilia glaciei TaxID=1524097 RepID=A0A2U2HIB6_9BURK|nr:hypothetical protein [Massilia glaciei]PWF46082.1 hypothetical protein C7C56_016310 [Massilia glaciei]